MRKYKVIIAGGRDFNDREFAFKKLDHLLKNLPMDYTEIVEGDAKGADRLGREYAQENNINFKTFPADWDNNGKAAGPIRNTEMADYSTHLVAFWDGKSRGTKHMIDTAKKKGLKVIVVKY